MIDAAKELGVTIVAFSPIGKGMLSGQYRKPTDFPDNDFRRTIPRFSEENFPKNLKIVDEFQKLAAKKGCTGSQLAIAWVIRQGAIPIPGTKSAHRVEENWGARDVELSDDEEKILRKLINEAKPIGDRYVSSISASSVLRARIIKVEVLTASISLRSLSTGTMPQQWRPWESEKFRQQR